MQKVKLHLNYAGYCFANRRHALRGSSSGKIKFHALWGLIEHPKMGYILYDTGYTRRFAEATRNFPNRIYAMVTPVYIEPEEEIHAQLAAHGIDPNEIEHIILTHFHADHLAGLRDFPKAKIYASRRAIEQATAISPAISFSKGILKPLIPTDFMDRAVIIEQHGLAMEDPILGQVYDLFGDESIRVVPLPGHAAGMVGVLLDTDRRSYFLIADACWLKESYEDLRLPHPLVRLFFDSWRDFKASLDKVHAYHKTHPKSVIVPTHCYGTTKELVSQKIDLNVL